MPPRSTTRSKPTFRRTRSTTFPTTRATIQPMKKMTRNATSLGTKLATDVQADDTPPPKSMAARVDVCTVRSLPGFWRRPEGTALVVCPLLPMAAPPTRARIILRAEYTPSSEENQPCTRNSTVPWDGTAALIVLVVVVTFFDHRSVSV